jgi:hypothetical protein
MSFSFRLILASRRFMALVAARLSSAALAGANSPTNTSKHKTTRDVCKNRRLIELDFFTSPLPLQPDKDVREDACAHEKNGNRDHTDRQRSRGRILESIGQPNQVDDPNADTQRKNPNPQQRTQLDGKD